MVVCMLYIVMHHRVDWMQVITTLKLCFPLLQQMLCALMYLTAGVLY